MTDIANAVADTETDARRMSLVWTEVGPGLWVAKCGADFAGLIEKLWGAGYRATDCDGRVLGEFASLSSAQRNIAA